MELMTSGSLVISATKTLEGAQGVGKLLDRTHARVRRNPLRDLGDGAVRNPRGLSEDYVVPLGFVQAPHHVVEERFLISFHTPNNIRFRTETQCPQRDGPIVDTPCMAKARDIAARNLARLMENSHLDTLEKVAAKAKIGYGTVRRVKTGEASTTLDNLEAIAHAFGLSLVEFLQDWDATPQQRAGLAVVQMLSDLPEDDRQQVVAYVTMRADMHATRNAAAAKGKADDIRKPRRKSE